MRQKIFSIFLIISLVIPFVIRAQDVSTSSLLDELINLEQLSELNGPGYKILHFTSYDRRSEGKSKDEIGWYANSDGFGKESYPNFAGVIEPADKDRNGKFLICDVEGPGSIIRLWSARFSGEVTIFLDKSNVPVYKGSADYFFRHAYDAIQNNPQPTFQNTLSQEFSGYYPIPFAKYCRIEWEGNLNELHFYYVQIRKYDAEVEVKTFNADDIRENSAKTDHIIEVLSDPDKAEKFENATRTLIPETSVKSGKSKEILKLTGTGAVQKISLKVKAGDLTKALRQNILRIVFDDYVWGQVQAPVGDFFVTAPGINPFSSLPFSVSKDSILTCRFKMPYKKSVTIYLDNLSDQDIKVEGHIVSKPYKWKEGKSMYFHASWRINHKLTAMEHAPVDLVFLMAHGKGRYVGTSVFIKNPATGPDNWGNWWGEGDEKIYIDDNKFPVIFGTGSEDYFGYAWSSANLFDHAFIGQPRNDGPGNRGFVTNYRFHIIDDLPFNKHLSFFMELFPHDSIPDFTYGRTVYYYGVPGTYDDHQVITRDDVKIPVLPETWRPKQIKGSSGFVFYEAEDVFLSGKHITSEQGQLWSDRNVLIWKPEQNGDKIVFDLPAPVQKEKMEIRLTTKVSPAGGSFTVKLNGKKMNGGAVYNLYDDYHTRSVSIYRSTTKAEDKNKLELTFEGEKGQEIGVDFIWIR
ncbi:glycoside hydrolase family 172 protein [Bacteroidota bacterium]